MFPASGAACMTCYIFPAAVAVYRCFFLALLSQARPFFPQLIAAFPTPNTQLKSLQRTLGHVHFPYLRAVYERHTFFYVSFLGLSTTVDSAFGRIMSPLVELALVMCSLPLSLSGSHV